MATNVDMTAIVSELRSCFRTGRTQALSWRREQMFGLRRFLTEREDAICEAVHQDLGRSHPEAWPAEIGAVQQEITTALRNLSSWTARKRVRLPLLHWPAKAGVTPQPLGVVAILGPWNYPFQLVLSPLVGALAAGNCVILKPSEYAPASAGLLGRELPAFLDPQAIRVIEGDSEVARQIVAEPLDHIFFTGGTAIGRCVMRAAAEHLVPVTLELGGKNPCLIDASVDLKTAARRIAWGRFLNAGQICLAPDYVLAMDGVGPALLDHLAKVIENDYGPDPRKSPHFGRIVNERHVQRLAAMLQGVAPVVGGQFDERDRYVAPTLVKDPPLDHALMAEEIFGPILPVLQVDGLEQALNIVRQRPTPLALYCFSNDRSVRRRVRTDVRAGAISFNETVMHIMAPNLPFGGVGASGMGRYHGRAGFETFSHLRGELERPLWFDPSLRYPPYSSAKLRWLRWFLR